MSIALSASVGRGIDSTIEIRFIGINYDQNKAIVRLVYGPSGTEREFTFDGNALQGLRNNVPQFNGLRLAFLQYLQTLAADLAGNAT